MDPHVHTSPTRPKGYCPPLSLREVHSRSRRICRSAITDCDYRVAGQWRMSERLATLRDMNREPPHNLTRRKALGITMSAAPPLQQLRDEAKTMLDSGRPREEVEAHLRHIAVAHPEMGLRAMLGINRRIARFSASRLMIELGKHYSKLLRKKSVQDALGDYARKHGLDRWLSEYILGWIDTGEPPAFREADVQWVGDMEIGPEGDKTPLVGVLINGIADPHEAAQKFIVQCHQSFPPETFARKGMAIRDAERFRSFALGKTDFEIAKAELEAEGSTEFLISTGEYSAEVATRANSVLVSRKRWDAYLTKLLDPVSPVSA